MTDTGTGATIMGGNFTAREWAEVKELGAMPMGDELKEKLLTSLLGRAVSARATGVPKPGALATAPAGGKPASANLEDVAEPKRREVAPKKAAEGKPRGRGWPELAPIEQRDWVTLKEVLELTGRSYATVYRRVKEEQWPTEMLGGRTVYNKAQALDAFKDGVFDNRKKIPPRRVEPLPAPAQPVPSPRPAAEPPSGETLPARASTVQEAALDGLLGTGTTIEITRQIATKPAMEGEPPEFEVVGPSTVTVIEPVVDKGPTSDPARQPGSVKITSFASAPPKPFEGLVPPRLGTVGTHLVQGELCVEGAIAADLLKMGLRAFHMMLGTTELITLGISVGDMSAGGRRVYRVSELQKYHAKMQGQVA